MLIRTKKLFGCNAGRVNDAKRLALPYSWREAIAFISCSRFTTNMFVFLARLL
jgi:hypothetical protein